ncbi:MAG: hypothetical protein A2V74_07170 [Acidobacteria bacterium RBG_16_70_10]|nr:MAG: hypothetical protein A2V74_07170 [Acidobacteria bacterium RBG_16_70_10]
MDVEAQAIESSSERGLRHTRLGQLRDHLGEIHRADGGAGHCLGHSVSARLGVQEGKKRGRVNDD